MSTKISQEALDQALITELCSGRKFLEANERYREDEASAEAKKHIGHAANTVLGKHVLSVPQEEWFAIRNDPRFGEEAWQDRGFIRDFGRLNPHLRSNRV